MKIVRTEYHRATFMREVEVDEQLWKYVIRELNKEIKDFNDKFHFTLEDLESIMIGDGNRWSGIQFTAFQTVACLVEDLVWEYVDMYTVPLLKDSEVVDWETEVIR
jgi:hypothetical protein